MKLSPKTHPSTSPSERAKRLAKLLPTSIILGSALFPFNATQLASAALLPVSRKGFQRYNRWVVNTWIGWSVQAAERLWDTRIVLTGDRIDPKDNALLILNHQQTTDITFLTILGFHHGRLGDMKWFMKKSLRWLPGIGWGLMFVDCLFVERRWAEDRASIEQTFHKILRDKIPTWLVLFPEGTRFTEAKAQSSRAFAAENGLPQFRHLLLPRTKGFVASVRGMRGFAQAIYDITVGYPNGVPTFGQYMLGEADIAHLHVRRFPMNEIPDDDAEVKAWLIERFEEKDALLEHFHQHGAFPTT